ncbi:hypothetical protein TNIN_469381 [Trichonephila inaurata madagascariensis]|uniref:Uncharacterized protein n=1 Tax=Trichonephila inaurata madagascariensis TaxID=2747483 RepID=A0A8X6XMG8_9ARAC|nr:hypothetical protein TNIN_469381 [Trichonephila inaurata madagascariensis]
MGGPFAKSRGHPPQKKIRPPKDKAKKHHAMSSATLHPYLDKPSFRYEIIISASLRTNLNMTIFPSPKPRLKRVAATLPITSSNKALKKKSPSAGVGIRAVWEARRGGGAC